MFRQHEESQKVVECLNIHIYIESQDTVVPIARNIVSIHILAPFLLLHPAH
jgi:hypothetical protein